MLFLIILLYALFALTFTFAKLVLAYTTPIFFIGIRMLISGLLLLSYQYYKTGIIKFNKQDRNLFLSAALFHIYFPYIFEFFSLQYILAAKISLFYNLMPFLSAILLYFLYNKKITTKQTVGLIIGFLGFVPILISQNALGTNIFKISFPELVLFFGVLSAVYGWILVKDLIDKNYDAYLINGYAMLMGGIFALITAGFIENPDYYVLNIKPFLIYMFLLIFISNIFCYNLYAHLLKKYSATFLSFVGFITPFFTAFYDFVFLKQSVNSNFFISMFIIFIGLYIFYKDEFKN